MAYFLRSFHKIFMTAIKSIKLFVFAIAIIALPAAANAQKIKQSGVVNNNKEAITVKGSGITQIIDADGEDILIQGSSHIITVNGYANT